MRALQGDLVPERQQHAMQSAIVVMAGLGDFSVNMVVERLADPVEHLQWLCLVVATVYVCTSAAMFFISREQQYQLPPQDLVTEPLKRTTWGARVRQAPAWVGLFFKSIPPWLWRVGSAMALGFFAFFCIMPNSSAWLGSSVLQGSFMHSGTFCGCCNRLANLDVFSLCRRR